MPRYIDLNCDLGESQASEAAQSAVDKAASEAAQSTLDQSAALMPLISSANIACGFHAGDANTMQFCTALAQKLGVAIGAHPGFPDKLGFGRRDMQLSASTVYNDTIYQIAALAGFAKTAGAAMVHVKPHGALYHACEKDAQTRDAFVLAVRDFDPNLRIVGLAGGALVRCAEALGSDTLHEVFADRGYQGDTLIARGEPGAMMDDPALAGPALLALLKRVKRADTICIHGDKPGAVDFAQAIRVQLEQAGWQIARADQAGSL
jgi:5-oxoprolinase (ATP-hydrolysing) subunit A